MVSGNTLTNSQVYDLLGDSLAKFMTQKITSMQAICRHIVSLFKPQETPEEKAPAKERVSS